MSHCFVDIDVKMCNTNSNELVMDFFFHSYPLHSVENLRTLTSHKFQIIYRICCPSGLFSSILLVITTLTLQNLKFFFDIIKDDRDNNEGVLH